MQRCVFQSQYDIKQDPRVRNKQGQFATPPQLSLAIAECMAALIKRENSTVHFLEPAVGTGSFYSALLQTLPTEKIASATGIEIDPELARMAKTLWNAHGLRIIEGDFTKIPLASLAPTPNLILANPPYVRHHHLAGDEKFRLQRLAMKVSGIEVSGLAGLYVYYLLIASSLLAQDGLAAWLIPSEFMAVNYGSALRRYLTEKVALLRIHQFDPSDIQFDDALVSSAVVMFRKRPAKPSDTVQFSLGGTIAEPKETWLVPVSILRESAKWNHRPNISGQDSEPKNTGIALADLFRIQRGIATGANEVFVLPRKKATELEIPPIYLRPILPSPRILRTTIIDRDADGHPRIPDQYVIVDCDLPESVLADHCPPLSKYLLSSAGPDIRDRYLLKKRSPWYKQERRLPSPFLCTYMGRGTDHTRPFRFILNHSDAIATNLYLLLYPKPPLAAMMATNPSIASLVFAALSQITGNDLRLNGRVYGGGLHKIEPKELGRISAEGILHQVTGLKEIADRFKWQTTPIKNFGGLFDSLV